MVGTISGNNSTFVVLFNLNKNLARAQLHAKYANFCFKPKLLDCLPSAIQTFPGPYNCRR